MQIIIVFIQMVKFIIRQLIQNVQPLQILMYISLKMITLKLLAKETVANMSINVMIMVVLSMSTQVTWTPIPHIYMIV